jgi:hypothetical protein
MRRFWAVFFLLLLLSIQKVDAADLGPGIRLILAAIVAQHSPLLSGIEKRTIAQLAVGNLEFRTSLSRSIAVTASNLECRASNIDITSRTCKIQFDHRATDLKGREANELFATLLEMGVVPAGAAGSIFIGLSQLNCLVYPRELRQKSGGGVACKFEASTG